MYSFILKMIKFGLVGLFGMMIDFGTTWLCKEKLKRNKYVSNGYFYTYDDDYTTPGVTTTIEGAGYYPQATRNFFVGISLVF